MLFCYISYFVGVLGMIISELDSFVVFACFFDGPAAYYMHAESKLEYSSHASKSLLTPETTDIICNTNPSCNAVALRRLQPDNTANTPMNEGTDLQLRQQT